MLAARAPALREALRKAKQTHQRLTGPNATADYANPAQMNHFTRYQTNGWTKPYPGEDQIFAPDQVPGAHLPALEGEG